MNGEWQRVGQIQKIREVFPHASPEPLVRAVFHHPPDEVVNDQWPILSVMYDLIGRPRL